MKESPAKQSYQGYLKSEEWRIRRDLIKSRDRYRCRLCHSAESLQVHHATYENRGAEKDNDLITLCGECHAKFHQKPRPKFGAIWGQVLQDLHVRNQSAYWLLESAIFTRIKGRPKRALPAFQIAMYRPVILLDDTARELVSRLLWQRSGQRVRLSFVRQQPNETSKSGQELAG